MDGPRVDCRIWVAVAAIAAQACQGEERLARVAEPKLVDSAGAAYLANEVILRIAPTTDSAQLDDLLEQLDAQIVDDGSPLAQRFGFLRLRLPPSVGADAAIDRLQRSGVVAQADRHYLLEASEMPDDPDFSQLWGLHRVGVEAAWAHTTGDREMVVAVIDTGVDLDHPDLAANLWRNPGEIPDNGVDDDGNGYVDDVHGWDFVNHDPDPDDDHGHGSHCAGTIGAVGNDGRGLVGVNWRVSLMSLKVLSSNGSGSLWGLAEAILYAADLGVPVANASLGCDGCNVSYVRSALDTYQQAGGLFVAAAGNSGKNNDVAPHYPSSHAHEAVISVAATDSDDRLASFSNYGVASVDLAAPGVGILSTTPGGRTSVFSGTSMAAPHVAGAVALYWSHRPSMTAAKVKERLLATSSPLASLDGKVVTAGRLDAGGLLGRDAEPPSAPTGLRAEVGARSDVYLEWSPVAADDVAGYRVRWGNEPGTYVDRIDLPVVTSTRVSGLLDDQRYYFVVAAFDRNGNFSAPSNEVVADPSDSAAPPAVVDLRAEPIPGPILDARVTAASGEYSGDYVAGHATDGSADTAWISPRRETAQEEYLVLRLGQPGAVSQVDLQAPPGFPEFFPVGFDIEVSPDGAQWIPVAGRRHVSVPLDWLSVRFADTLASHVRIRVTETYEHRSGHHYTGLAEVRVRGPILSPDALRIEFTAPGDDPGEGAAASYEVRVSTAPLTPSNFASAHRVSAPAPRGSGVPVDHVISGLEPETTYFVALRATDDAGNRSPMSNVAIATTMVVPPAAITDLGVDRVAGNGVTLSFTAVGGDGIAGKAAAYDLRYAAVPLTAANFGQATRFEDLPAPNAAGQLEAVEVIGLPLGEYYYFAIKAVDETGHEGPLSNVVGAFVEDGVDDRPPARVDDLAVFLSRARLPIDPTIHADSGARPSQPASHLLDGDTVSVWQAPDAPVDAPAWVVFDLGAVRSVAEVKLHPGLSGVHAAEFPTSVRVDGSVDAVSWTTLAQRSGLSASTTWASLSVPFSHVRYVRLYVAERGLGACRSDQPTCHRPVTVSVAEIRGAADQHDADLTWVAPGDDAFIGVAAQYELRTATEALTEANFEHATAIALPAPRPGGMLELHRLPALPPEATHFFALRAHDDAGNAGLLSNVVSVTVPGVPPAPIIDLHASTVTANSVALAWTAPGDDGHRGTATAYDLRFAKDRIVPDTWADATAVTGVGAPRPAGSAEAFAVTALEPDETYYFAIVTRDERGQASVMSNVLRVDTPDGTPPGRVTDLSTGIVDPNLSPRLSSAVGPYSGAYSFETEPDNLVDGVEATIWLSPARISPQEEILTFDLGPSTLGRFRLRSAPAFTDLFPRAFRLEVRSSSQQAWRVVLDERGIVNRGGWHEWSIGAVSAAEARLVISEGGVWNGDHFAALAEVAFHSPRAEQLSVNLSWTAPGDDDDEGTATRYDIRRSGSAIAEGDFSRAIAVSPVPTPAPAGTLERHTVGGLAPDTHYCFALRAEDEVPQTGPVSNSACIDTPAVAPNPVSDLAVTTREATALSLRWTAPGAQADQGAATSYDVRMSTRRITVGNWAEATPIHGVPTPAAAGAVQTHRVTGLLGQTRYYFALTATNDRQQTSPLSNNAEGTTLDEVAPTVITDLALTTDTSASGRITATWTAPGDGETGTLAEYDLRISPAAITEADFATATRVTQPAPRAPGAAEHANLTGLASEALYFAAVKTKDDSGNWSAMSNVAEGRTRDEAPSRVTDLAVSPGATDTALTLEWTAPGDDGAVGRAAAYDVRYSTTYISLATFDRATAVPNVPAPSLAGQRDSVRVDGLIRGTTYYFALKATDDRGNVSAMSNWVSSQTADSLPPATIADLSASSASAPGRVDLSWTAPGDDGDTGLAQAYELRYSFAPITAANFQQAQTTLGQPTPWPSGQRQAFVAVGLPDEAQLHFAIRARDDAGNWSIPSNSTSARTADVAPRQVTDLRQVGDAATSVTVSWTAPGDDRATGTATRYDLRWSAAPIDASNFGRATAATAPAPRPAGLTEQATISGLSGNSAYYVALEAIDDRGNHSPLSNVLRVETADTRPPGAITDLTATTHSVPSSLTLTWSAPGDDGMDGVARRYDVRRSETPIVSEAEWNRATVVSGAPRPGAPTAQEYFRVTGLTGERTYHFAVKAFDEADNAGPRSNSAVGQTAPVPPSRVTDLAATAGAHQMTLQWTAPGDDDRTGTADSYDVRYSTELITASSFERATRWGSAPSPAAAGTRQAATITGLVESTRYYFALKATDDVGASSVISNVVHATTPDLTAPAAPGALAGAPPGHNDTPLRAASAVASSALAGTWSADQLIDGDVGTSWASAGQVSLHQETVTVDFGVRSTVDRVQVHPDAVYPELFPKAFIVETSVAGSQWDFAARAERLTVSDVGWLDYGFRAREARYVRVRATDLSTSFGAHYAIVAELRAFAAPPDHGQVHLTWVAPGDDAHAGTADRYELFAARQTFDPRNPGAPSSVPGLPAPSAAGTLQSAVVDQLMGESRYWFGLRAVDEAGNVGDLAGPVEAQASIVAPAPVIDLVASTVGTSEVELRWTAPGDDGLSGTATRYEIRYAPWSITSRSFPLATAVARPVTPAAAGARQQQSVSGLQSDTRYRFALVAYDDANTASYLSNVAHAVTAAAADVTAPGAVSNLDARAPSPGGRPLAANASDWSSQQSPDFEASAGTDGAMTTAWSAAESTASAGAWLRIDLGLAQQVDEVRAHPLGSLVQLFPRSFSFRVSPDGLRWTTVRSFSQYSATAGQPAVASFSSRLVRYVELDATVLAPFNNNLFYAVVAELEAVEAAPTPGTAIITWTAPGDDGHSGRAASYDLRAGSCPYDHGTATPLATPSPAPAGQPERVVVSGLASGTLCFGLETADEAGNVSPLSNVPTL